MVRVVFTEVPRLRSPGAEEQTMYVFIDCSDCCLGSRQGGGPGRVGDHPGGYGSDPAQRGGYRLQYNTQLVIQRLQLVLITCLFCADWKGQPQPTPRGRVLISIPEA